MTPAPPSPYGDGGRLDAIGATRDRADRVRHIEVRAAQPGQTAPWPTWANAELVGALRARGIRAPWLHQVQAAQLAHSGRHVVLATGTASGKSLAYLLPAVSELLAVPAAGPLARPASALYLSPTKALAADQLSALEAFGLPGLRAATYDGDTALPQRRWVRQHAAYVLTNADLLHHSMLPGHAHWARFLGGLRYVVVDECHYYRGIFGSHVAAVLRRLRRLAAHYGAHPVFIACSATVAEPALHASRLTGLPMQAVTQDAAPRGRLQVVLWEPPLQPGGGENGAPTRHSADAETAELLADLVVAGVRTVAFVSSRRGVETVAASARRLVAAVDERLPRRIAGYRGGYLPEERRALERRLRSGDLLGLAATNALELGVDISGLDAVLLAGWPGRRASMQQQVGRAGRAGQDALAVLVAADNPLDTYLVHHPDAVFGPPLEQTVLDPDNPYVLAPQLAAAAAELALAPDDVATFGPAAPALLEVLVARGLLRRRPSGWFWARTERATDHVSLRGDGGPAYQVVESPTGRVLGTVDEAGADRSVHDGAVYVHQGQRFVVQRLDHAERLALVQQAEPDWTTQARTATRVRLIRTLDHRTWGPVTLAFGTVEVTSRVVSFLRRCVRTGKVLGEEPLDLPERVLSTKAVWWTTTALALEKAGVGPHALAGALHAAEHAVIALLPLVATCDRWDVGGVFGPCHEDTGAPTLVVHDGSAGGAGFAERGFGAVGAWWQAALEAVASCACPEGCPSCVQSPSCGTGNQPLDKAGAVRVLRLLVDHAARA